MLRIRYPQKLKNLKMSTEYLIRVVNKRTHKGEPAEYIGRPSVLGNPFTVKQWGREQAISKYKEWLNLQWMTEVPAVSNELIRLATKLKQEGQIILSCWCAPEKCHGEEIGRALLGLIKQKIV